MSITTSILGILLVVGGYLLGSLLPADYFVRRKTGKTPEELNDNPGGMGTVRRAGIGPGVATIIFDIGKGILPVAIAVRLALPEAWVALAAAAPVVGHSWPVWRGFKGGRGMAAATGASWYLGWPLMPIAYIAAALAGLLTFRWVPAVGLIAYPMGIAWMIADSYPADRIWAIGLLGVVLLVRELPWLEGRDSQRRQA